MCSSSVDRSRWTARRVWWGACRRMPHPAAPRRASPLLATLLSLLGMMATPPGAACQARSEGPAHPSPPFAPLTLNDVLRGALRQHPLLAAAEARVRAARGARSTAGVLGNPVLAFDLDNTRLPGGAQPDMPQEATTTATFPLEVLYQRGPRVRRADAELRAAEADAAADRQRLSLDAAHAYYRLALAQQQVAAAHDLVAWLDSLVAYNRTRVREGAAAEADLLRTGLERDRARADLTMDQVERVSAQAELAGLMGDSTGVPAAMPREAATALTVVTPVTPLRVPSLGVSLWPDTSAMVAEVVDRGAVAALDTAFLASALAGRPEMRAARERLVAAGAGITAEHRMLLRQLGATIGAKQSGGTTSLVLGASLPLPLFDQNRGEVARARAERDVRTAELAGHARTVGAEVAGSVAAAQLLTARVETLSRGTAPDTLGYLARADEARRITLGAYQEGAVPLLQVLDAARAWGEARLTFYGTLYAQHESVLTVLAASGADVFATLLATSSADAASPEVPR